MSKKKLVVHETNGNSVPDICGTAIELINPETTDCTKVSFAKLIIDPGNKSRRHYHKETEEIYYILSGSGKIIMNDEEFDICPGHAIFIPIGVSHQIINTSNEQLIFVCADSPIFDPKDVVEI